MKQALLGALWSTGTDATDLDPLATSAHSLGEVKDDYLNLPWTARIRRDADESSHLPFPLPLRQPVIGSRDLKSSYLEEQDPSGLQVAWVTPRIDFV